MTKCKAHKNQATFCDQCIESAIVGYVCAYYGSEEAHKVVERFNERIEETGYT